VGDPRSSHQLLTDATGDADVHAFLIADVRGWTMFTQERGDEEAARLAGRFAEVTRSVVEAHRGNVLELRGDEALVVFGSPRSAIRGAVALQQRFVEETIADPSLPLTVGIGLDAGEAVPVEGGYRGGALNVAARLCSIARAGEVLASREIVHLARRVDGIQFTERGPSELKGLDKPVYVVAVRSEERDDAQAIAPFVRSSAPPPRRRWKAVAAATGLAVVAALVAVPIVNRDADANAEIAPNSIGVLDPESGEVTATVGLEDRPGSVATSAGAVWVTNPDVGTVTRIDANELAVVDTIQVGENPTGIAVGFDAVWVVESGGPSVSRISPETNTVVGESIAVGNGPASIAVGEGSVWVTNRFDGTISRIDPNSGEVIEIPVGLDPRGLAIGFGGVWVGLAGSNTVVLVDPRTNEVSAPIGVGTAPGSLAVSADAVWVVNTLDDTVSRISPDTNSVVNTIPVGDGPSGIAIVDGTVWVANEAQGTLSRIEPDQATASPLVIGSVPQGLTGVGGDLWVSVRGTATSHRGGTLRLVSLRPPGTLDPAVAYDYISWRLPHLLGDGLLAFEPIGGANSSLVPDLATSTPTPTDGGRTYSFGLRPGIRYSNGEIVAATDFRRAFERGFPLNPFAHEYLYGGLVGGEACADEPRTCDLSEGIVTDDASGTITFHLVAADPEFPYKLTLPFAYPVPPSVSDEEQVTAGIPSTGPYMLEAPMTDEGLILVRNPHFEGWSSTAQPDGFVDRIEWIFGVAPRAQIDDVAAGDADLAFDTDASGRLEQIVVQFAAQIHTSSFPVTFFAVLDTESPPFNDVQVRRAMNFAVDRDRVVEIMGGEKTALPSCQNLPPNSPGYEPYCPYTLDPGPEGEGLWTASDLEEAERLVHRSGTARMRVVVEYSPLISYGNLLGEYMIDVLDELGYRGSLKHATLGEFNSPATEFQIAIDAWSADYPAASSFISPKFKCRAPYSPSARFCDPGIDTMIDRATQMQLDDPAVAGELWAEIDRKIVDQAPYLWLASSNGIEFVSERTGNYQYSPQWGVLLNQLWVQ
jgi:YVTN family beta-propeller protein